MAKTVGDFLHKRLRAWGVQRVFGYPGDGINGIMAAFEHAGDEAPRFVQARHEALAAFHGRARTRSSPARPECAWLRRGLAQSIC